MKNYLSPQLEIRNFSQNVRLGCTEMERRSPQEVHITVKIFFLENPPGAYSDRLDETICYGEICGTIEQTFVDKEFHLIETMGANLYKAIKASHSKENVQIEIHKLTPPIENLIGGVFYRCGDPLP